MYRKFEGVWVTYTSCLGKLLQKLLLHINISVTLISFRDAELPPFAIIVTNANKLSDTDMLLLEYTSGKCKESKIHILINFDDELIVQTIDNTLSMVQTFEVHLLFANEPVYHTKDGIIIFIFKEFGP